MIEPYAGAKAIVDEACSNSSEITPELLIFVGLESEYADFTDDIRAEYYTKPHCDDVLATLRERIHVEARRLIANDV